MKEKEVLTDLIRSLDVEQVKRKHKLTDDKLRELLGNIAKQLPNDKPVKKQTQLPLFSGKRDFVIFVDGASKGNPGPASLGILITDNLNEEVLRVGEKLGKRTNNQAEYGALIRALELAADLKGEKILIKSDSELMVKQMTGQYKVRNANILPLYQTAKKLSAHFNTFLITHIPRTENAIADSLANAAIKGNLHEVL